MDKLRFILLFVVVLLAGNAAAYDFESGGLFYNILDADAKTVELTCQNYTDWNTQSDYTGDIVVPAVVTSGDVTYNVVKIGHHAFKKSGITTLSISEGVEIIDQDICEGCYQLTEISLPSTLKSIGYAAFWNCSGLTSITIPNSVSYIGDGVFRGCTGLTSVIVECIRPLTIHSYDFPNRANSTLYVPAGSKAAYEAADYWKEFKEIIEMTSPTEPSTPTTPTEPSTPSTPSTPSEPEQPKEDQEFTDRGASFEVTGSSGGSSTVAISDDWNVSGNYTIPEKVWHRGVE